MVILLPNGSNSRTETSCDCRDWEREGGGLAETNGKSEKEFALFWPGSAALSQGMVSPQTSGQMPGDTLCLLICGWLSASCFCADIWKWSMLEFLLLSPFLVEFLPSCARQGPQQEQGGHFSTWAVTEQGWQKGQGSAGRAGLLSPGNRDGIYHCGVRAHSSLFPQEQGQDSTEIPSDSSNSLCGDGCSVGDLVHFISLNPTFGFIDVGVNSLQSTV